MKAYHWIILLLAAALVAVSVRLANVSESKDAATDGTTGATNIVNTILTRASVRSYSDKVVSDSTLEQILRAGMAAPSAVNAQPWEFVVINEQALKDSISDNFRNIQMARSCAVAVVVCGNMERLFKDDKKDGGYWVQDCSAVTENMLLAAHGLGLGAVWCGIYPIEEREIRLSQILNLPQNLRPLNVICFGYPLNEPIVKEKWDPEKIHYNAF